MAILDLKHVCFSGRPVARTVRRAAIAPSPPSAAPALCRRALELAGLRPRDYASAPLRRREAACRRALGALDESGALGALEGRPGAAAAALNAVLVGVTGFFRDAAVFEALESGPLPELLASRRGLRACSLGAASGQELYSLAMILEELGALDASALVGVDCRTEALSRAAAGVYSADETSGVSSERLSRHFLVRRGGWAVADRLKSACVWRRADVAAGVGGEWDLILYRNLSIYFAREASAAVWAAVGRGLSPGGLLVTGPAERPPAALGLRRRFPCVFQAPEKLS